MSLIRSSQPELRQHAPPAHIPVWDLPTRLFHWGLVVAVTGAGLTETLFPGSYLGSHLVFGYAVGALVAFRLVWGFFATEFCRHSHLKPSPREAIDFVRAFLARRAPHHLGHNPGGALMVAVILTTLIAMVVAGMLAQAGQKKQGPFAGFVSFDVGSAARDVHSALFNVLLVLIGMHILAVLLHVIRDREPLIRAMITGAKPWRGAPPVVRTARPLAALATLAALVAGGWALVAGAYRVPPLGMPVLPANDTYALQCTSCHMLYHPSLLPAASWRTLMANLKSHFDADASLSPEQIAEITAYLTTYSGAAFDTEAGREIAATVSPDNPTRITQSRFWVRKHQWIPPEAFKDPKIDSKSNCEACHSDAQSGRFDDQAITFDEGLNL